jgi:uncharacterized protein
VWPRSQPAAFGGVNLLQMAVTLQLRTHHLLIAERVIEASSVRGRARGLLGKQLGSSEALLLRPCKHIHTVGMRYPIDVVFCDQGLRVLHVARSVAPNRFSRPVWRSRCAFELRAGAAQMIAAGDELQLRAPV